MEILKDNEYIIQVVTDYPYFLELEIISKESCGGYLCKSNFKEYLFEKLKGKHIGPSLLLINDIESAWLCGLKLIEGVDRESFIIEFDFLRWIMDNSTSDPR